MAAAELPKPGVEVVQVIRTVSPTVVTPTLVPCVVGVAKQVVELLLSDGSGGKTLNGDALIALPAFFIAKAGTGSPAKYTGLDGLVLKLSFTNGPVISILFADPLGAGLTPATVVSTTVKALAAAGVTSATAETVGNAFRIRTLATGEFQSILIDPTTSPAVLSAFGIGAGRTYTGVANYSQFEEVVPVSNFPDPRGNLAELAIESDTIRVFLAMSSSNFMEVLRTESLLRYGTVATAATVTGSVDLSSLTLPDDLEGLTLIFAVGSGADQTITFTAAETTPAAVIAFIDANSSGVVPSLTPTTNHLSLVTEDLGAAARITIRTGTATAALGLTPSSTVSGTSVQVVDDGNGDNFSPLLKFAGVDFTAVGTAASIVGTTSIATPAGLAGKTLDLSDGQQVQTITFSASATTSAAVLTEINAIMGAAAGGRVLATANGSSYLVLTSTKTGSDSMLWVKGGTALTILGLTADTIQYGALGHVASGDELYIDGLIKGTVIAVAPGGATDTLKINNQQVITLSAGTNWHIIAKGLTGTGVDRPQPELVVDSSKNAILKHTLLRDVVGRPIHPTQGRAPVYLAYTAVRKDVTSAAARPGLLTFDGQTQLENSLSPIDTRNPLALGLFFAMVNAPGVQTTGLGVDEVSADSPYGTTEAFTRAVEFLEAFEVYALAPLTHDQAVGQVFDTHVNFMSEPTQKGERIALFNAEQPSYALDTLVTSGANGNSSGTTGLSFDTGVPNLSALLMNKGINPIGTIPTESGVFLDIASDAKNYSIESISGAVVTIRTVLPPGTNDDDFYANTALNLPPLPSQLIAETFAIKIRGAALLTLDGMVDKQKVAETYAAMGQSFLNRRLWSTAPDKCAATVGGIEQVLEGFYMNAGIVGMIGQQPPQQSFTNFPMSGYTRVIGSSQYFSEHQMDVMAGGGTYIIIQDSASSPLISRMALTTDTTSVETRTDSITKVVDFTAKFLRRGLKNFIGRFNITQAFLDQLGTVTGGLGGFLVEVGVLVGFNLNNIIQDEQAPDTVLIDVLIDPPYPCNYIRITLVI